MEEQKKLPSYYWLSDDQPVFPGLDKNYDMNMRESGTVCPNCGCATPEHQSVPQDIVFNSRPTGFEIPNPFAHVYREDFLKIVRPHLAHYVEGAVYWMRSGKRVLAPDYRSIYTSPEHGVYIYKKDLKLIAKMCILCDFVMEYQDHAHANGYFLHSEVGHRLAVQFGVRGTICVQKPLLDQLTESGLHIPEIVEYAQYDLPRPPFTRKRVEFMTYITHQQRMAEREKS